MRTEVLRLGKDKVCVGNQWTENKSNDKRKINKTKKKNILLILSRDHLI